MSTFSFLFQLLKEHLRACSRPSERTCSWMCSKTSPFSAGCQGRVNIYFHLVPLLRGKTKACGCRGARPGLHCASAGASCRMPCWSYAGKAARAVWSCLQSWSSLCLERLVQLHLLWVLPFDGRCLAAAAVLEVRSGSSLRPQVWRLPPAG